MTPSLNQIKPLPWMNVGQPASQNPPAPRVNLPFHSAIGSVIFGTGTNQEAVPVPQNAQEYKQLSPHQQRIYQDWYLQTHPNAVSGI
jgi:hypothetical protein